MSTLKEMDLVALVVLALHRFELMICLSYSKRKVSSNIGL